jgi:hypothetical protein
VQADPDFLIEHFENLLVGAAPEHIAMLFQRLDRLDASPRRRQVEIIVPVWGKVAQPLPSRDQVFDRDHEDVDGGVEPLRDGVVERRFKLFLLAHDGVEKISSIDVGGLFEFE